MRIKLIDRCKAAIRAFKTGTTVRVDYDYSFSRKQIVFDNITGGVDLEPAFYNRDREYAMRLAMDAIADGVAKDATRYMPFRVDEKPLNVRITGELKVVVPDA